MTDTKIKIVLEMFLLIFNSAEIWFAKKKQVQRTYSTTKALPTIQKVEIINTKKFRAVALDEKDEIFEVHIAATSIKAALNVYFS